MSFNLAPAKIPTAVIELTFSASGDAYQNVDLKGWTLTGYAVSEDTGLTTISIAPILPYAAGDVVSASNLNTNTNKTENTFYPITSAPPLNDIRVTLDTARTLTVLLFLKQV